MTTKEAFEAMIFERGIHHTLGIPRQRVYEFRKNAPPVQKQVDLLKKAGWKMSPENWFSPLQLITGKLTRKKSCPPDQSF